MADPASTSDPTTATASSPWFTQQNPTGQGLSTTVQTGVLAQQTNGVANDLNTQNASALTALASIVTALNNLPAV